MGDRKEIIKSEIQLADDECCIVFDLGCYFPYANPEVLTFDFQLGMETFDDYKLNHRYPNKGYQTISKKYGRRVSKLGYPYIMKLDKQGIMLLCINIGINNDYLQLLFPVVTEMTKEKPVCGLTLHYLFDKNEFCFTSYEAAKDGGWYGHTWSNHELIVPGKNDILLDTPHRVSEDSFALIYDNVITPCPSTMEDLLII